MYATGFLVSLALSTLVGSVVGQDVPYTEKYYDQIVDHFNFYSKQYGKSTYKQRYLMQDKWWKQGEGPIFFYTGNEMNIETFWNSAGFLFDIAPQFHALVVFAEHRFYGKSLPFGNQSFDHPYVDLLTVEQTLADFAYLVTAIKEEYNATNVPVISFGGSYGGQLTSYFRTKYPNIVDGGLAASAPVLLVSGVVDRDFFFADATKDFHDAVPGCDDQFRATFDAIAKLAAQGSQGLKEISDTFHLCEPLKSAEEFTHLLGWMRNSLTYLAMFDYPYPTNFQTTLPSYPVMVACEKLMAAPDPIQGLYEATVIYYGDEPCHDIFQEFVECVDPTGCGTGLTGYAWDYQACTEMLMPAGTDGKKDMFPVLPNTMEQRANYCKQRWGVDQRLNWVNINLWGKELEHTSNLIFSNGDLDPWHRGGVTENMSETVVAFMIEGGAHHLDLRAANPADPPAVKSVREKEVAIIQKWIQQARRRRRH